MERRKSLLEIHAAVVLFGLAGLFGKWLVFSPVLIVLGRVFFASLALLLFALASGQKIVLKEKWIYPLFFLLGAILAVHWFCFFKSIQVSTVAVGLLSYSSFPVFTSILEPLLAREKLEKTCIAYAWLCVVGIFLIVPRFNMSDSVYRGVLWGLAAGMTFSVLTILNRKLAQKYSSLTIAFYQDLFACFVLLPFLLYLRPSFTFKDLLLLFLLGVFCTAVSHTLFIKGMKNIKARTAAIISSLEPVYGIILALIVLQEIPTLRTAAGGLIILWAVISTTLKGAKAL
jgi:drug/metabolite transporter (DMT)-like permease